MYKNQFQYGCQIKHANYKKDVIVPAVLNSVVIPEINKNHLF